MIANKPKRISFKISMYNKLRLLIYSSIHHFRRQKCQFDGKTEEFRILPDRKMKIDKVEISYRILECVNFFDYRLMGYLVRVFNQKVITQFNNCCHKNKFESSCFALGSTSVRRILILIQESGSVILVEEF
jgi:hypothetical protein